MRGRTAQDFLSWSVCAEEIFFLAKLCWGGGAEFFCFIFFLEGDE